MGYFAYQLVSRISSINSRTNPGKEATFKRRAHHCIHDRNGARSHEEILLIFAWLNHLYPEGTIAGSRKIVDISHRNSSQLGNLTTSTGGWVVNWKFVRHLVLVVVVHGYLHPCPMVGSQAWLLVPSFQHFLKINGHFRFLVVYASLEKS